MISGGAEFYLAQARELSRNSVNPRGVGSGSNCEIDCENVRHSHALYVFHHFESLELQGITDNNGVQIIGAPVLFSRILSLCSKRNRDTHTSYTLQRLQIPSLF
jgi:hypothetical protein